jgi:hypothetical protein
MVIYCFTFVVFLHLKALLTSIKQVIYIVLLTITDSTIGPLMIQKYPVLPCVFQHLNNTVNTSEKYKLY